jgi:hypothetical protein
MATLAEPPVLAVLAVAVPGGFLRLPLLVEDAVAAESVFTGKEVLAAAVKLA